MNLLGSRIPLWDEFAYQNQPVRGGHRQGLHRVSMSSSSFFTRIAETGEKVLLGRRSWRPRRDALSEKVVIIMNKLGPADLVVEGVRHQVDRPFADAPGKVFDSFKRALDFFSQLAAKSVDVAGLAPGVTELVERRAAGDERAGAACGGVGLGSVRLHQDGNGIRHGGGH